MGCLMDSMMGGLVYRTVTTMTRKLVSQRLSFLTLAAHQKSLHNVPNVCQAIQITITSVQCQKRDQKTDLIRILSNLSRLVRVFLIRIDFDEPHCKACLGWLPQNSGDV